MKFKDLPQEVIDLIKIECRLQNSVYDENSGSMSEIHNGGFDWHRTDNNNFWNEVLSDNKFNSKAFYEKYPKKEITIEDSFVSKEVKIYTGKSNGKRYKITIELE